MNDLGAVFNRIRNHPAGARAEATAGRVNTAISAAMAEVARRGGDTEPLRDAVAPADIASFKDDLRELRAAVGDAAVELYLASLGRALQAALAVGVKADDAPAPARSVKEILREAKVVRADLAAEEAAIIALQRKYVEVLCAHTHYGDQYAECRPGMHAINEWQMVPSEEVASARNRGRPVDTHAVDQVTGFVAQLNAALTREIKDLPAEFLQMGPYRSGPGRLAVFNNDRAAMFAARSPVRELSARLAELDAELREAAGGVPDYRAFNASLEGRSAAELGSMLTTKLHELFGRSMTGGLAASSEKATGNYAHSAAGSSSIDGVQQGVFFNRPFHGEGSSYTAGLNEMPIDGGALAFSIVLEATDKDRHSTVFKVDPNRNVIPDSGITVLVDGLLECRRIYEAIVGLADKGDEAAIAASKELRPLMDESTFRVVRPNNFGSDQPVLYFQHQADGRRETFSFANIRNAVPIIGEKGLYAAARVAAVKREAIEMT